MNKNNKGPAETIKQQKTDLKKDTEGGMKKAGDVPGKKGGAKKDVMMDENMSGSGKKKGSAKHHGNMPPKKGSGDHKDGKKGGAKYNKGAGDYDVKKGSHDHPHGGPGRMGYTQNFGPARQNGYAKGAAKVAKIMGKGAASKGHGMDDKAHTHKDPSGWGDDRVFSLDVNSGSNIGDTNKSGYTTDFKPQHKDLGVVGRFENQTYMSSVGGSGSTYPGDHLDQVQLTGGPKGSVNKRGQVNPGFNFFRPSNSIDQKDLTKGAYVRDSRSGRPKGDGDTILTDYNQDGTMLGRGINALQRTFGYGKSKTDTSKVYPKKS